MIRLESGTMASNMAPRSGGRLLTDMASSTKRILLYGTNYYPEPIGIPRYTTEMAEDMAATGFAVTVIAAGPLYPTWTKQTGYRYGRYTREVRNGVTVRRVPTYVPRNAGFTQRILYELGFFLTSFPLLLAAVARGVDALVVTAPPVILTGAMLVPTRASKAVIVKDLQVDIAEQIGALRRGPLLRLLYAIERAFLNRADVVTAVSRGMLDRLADKRVTRPRLALFPDWVDTDRLRGALPDTARAKRAELRLPQDRIVVGYCGNLARKQGLELLVETARRFATRKITGVHFLICGDGPAKAGLQEIAQGLDNLTFTPLQPEAELPTLLSAIDLHVVLQRDEFSDLVMPGKMFNIMACGRAQVVTAPPDSAIDGVMRESNAGMRVERDARALDEAIAALCADASRRAAMGRAGRAFVEANMAKRTVLDLFYEQLLP